MQYSITLSDQLAKAFTPDRREEGRPLPYAFRPLVAHSAERKTVFSIFTGSVGLAACPLFTAALQDLCTEQAGKIILDFSQLALTKSAMGSLIGFAALCHGLNKRLYLYAASPQVRTLLQKLSLTPFFSYLENEDDIIATLIV